MSSFIEWFRHLFRTLPPDRRPDEWNGPEIPHSEFDAGYPFPQPVRLEIRDILDLHTFSPRDVHVVLRAYLAEAHKAGFKYVRIIHGKGKGFQREMVRRELANTPFVEHYSDAPADAGGWGATVVGLSLKSMRQNETEKTR